MSSRSGDCAPIGPHTRHVYGSSSWGIRRHAQAAVRNQQKKLAEATKGPPVKRDPHAVASLSPATVAPPSPAAVAPRSKERYGDAWLRFTNDWTTFYCHGNFPSVLPPRDSVYYHALYGIVAFNLNVVAPLDAMESMESIGVGVGKKKKGNKGRKKDSFPKGKKGDLKISAPSSTLLSVLCRHEKTATMMLDVLALLGHWVDYTPLTWGALGGRVIISPIFKHVLRSLKSDATTWTSLPRSLMYSVVDAPRSELDSYTPPCEGFQRLRGRLSEANLTKRDASGQFKRRAHGPKRDENIKLILPEEENAFCLVEHTSSEITEFKDKLNEKRAGMLLQFLVPGVELYEYSHTSPGAPPHADGNFCRYELDSVVSLTLQNFDEEDLTHTFGCKMCYNRIDTINFKVKLVEARECTLLLTEPIRYKNDRKEWVAEFIFKDQDEDGGMTVKRITIKNPHNSEVLETSDFRGAMKHFLYLRGKQLSQPDLQPVAERLFMGADLSLLIGAADLAPFYGALFRNVSTVLGMLNVLTVYRQKCNLERQIDTTMVKMKLDGTPELKTPPPPKPGEFDAFYKSLRHLFILANICNVAWGNYWVFSAPSAAAAAAAAAQAVPGAPSLVPTAGQAITAIVSLFFLRKNIFKADEPGNLGENHLYL